ncbi:MAG: CYTH domain-containing protein [Gammaproteobacteria bacterium]|nr:CYTH domain-containing protein [Gammaproteobacteria bacterium]
MPKEIEYKFQITPDQMVRLKDHEIIHHHAKHPPITQKIENIYFDTPKLALFQKNYVLRIRKQDGRYFQTLKFGECINREGLSCREEWEYELPRARFNFLLFPVEIQKIMPPEEVLKPQLIINFERTIYDLWWNDQTTVELAIDQGSIIAKRQVLSISEIELELKSGTQSALKILAEKLKGDLQLIPEIRGKAERGYELLMQQH